jgi:hypothetical protein
MTADDRPTLLDLIAAHRAGQATCKANVAARVLDVPIATFYRAMARGEVPGRLALGRRRLIALGPFLKWLGAEDDDDDAKAAATLNGGPLTGD